MDTSALKKFAQEARRELIEAVSSKVDYYLNTDNVEIRAKEQQVNELKEEVKKLGKEQLVEKVAYTWFNRFCALRFMDVNGYTPVGILTPAEGHTQPEIFQEAKEGYVRDDFGSEKSRKEVLDLIEGGTPSSNPHVEAYRKLFIITCNYFHSLMPFLFEKIEDFTELLLPDDLLSEDSIIDRVRQAVTKENCKDVEIIGWLYQFYISEKKDLVFAELKKNKKVTSDNIAAATQLFTPEWIVKYLVENTLGRLWLQNKPSSELGKVMNYYIAPARDESFLRISSPEDLKICDPACGSGHMLTYAFDILYYIYEEEGYEPSLIPNVIINKNLVGMEIDERAGSLASFALIMKARKKQRSYFRKITQPRVEIFEDVNFDEEESKRILDSCGEKKSKKKIKEAMNMFSHTRELGSLVNIDIPEEFEKSLSLFNESSGDMLYEVTYKKIKKCLQMHKTLDEKYSIVVANPPYMGSSGFNPSMKKNLESLGYTTKRSDLYAAFIQRIHSLACNKGLSGVITRNDWLFTKSYQYIREHLLKFHTINEIALLGKGVFDSLSGEVVKPVLFTLKNEVSGDLISGRFVNLSGSTDPKDSLLKGEKYEFLDQKIYEKLPLKAFILGESEKFYSVFDSESVIDNECICREGIHTGKNEKYLKYWWEPKYSKLVLNASSYSDLDSRGVYVPYNKGGTTDRWYGGNLFIIAFSSPYREEMSGLSGHVRPSESIYFKEGGTWSDVATKGFGVRYYPPGFLFDGAGPVVVNENIKPLIGLMNSKPFFKICTVFMPNLHFKCGTIKLMPLANPDFNEESVNIANRCIEITKTEYDSSELSWDFEGNPLVIRYKSFGKIEKSVEEYFSNIHSQMTELQKYEIRNNKLYIDHYDLGEELSPIVEQKELTLSTSPYKLFGKDKTEDEFTKLMYEKMIKDLISYFVGCLFGRYTIDSTGVKEIRAGGQCSKEECGGFVVDKDNTIPVLENDWFLDDIVIRFKEFLSLVFGSSFEEENLKFIETALGKNIRKYFVKDFYNDHLKMYKKRPIYWMFSSPKGSFNALIYMHRYTTDQASIVLNDYLREFKAKLVAKKEHLEGISGSSSASQSEKTKATKEIEKLKKILVELDDYEREVLYPLASAKIEIDLDDGVKANYPKFGKALKKVPGLS